MKLSEKYRHVTPQRTEQQLKKLEQLILDLGGPLFPLSTWEGILVDDYDTYDICQKNGIPFKTWEQPFPSEEEAISSLVYMQLNFGRLSPFQRCEILLHNTEALKATAHWRGYNFPTDFAEVAGVSQKTLNMAEEILNLGDEGILNQVRDEKISIKVAYIRSKEQAEMSEIKLNLQALIQAIDLFYDASKIIFPALRKIVREHYGKRAL